MGRLDIETAVGTRYGKRGSEHQSPDLHPWHAQQNGLVVLQRDSFQALGLTWVTTGPELSPGQGWTQADCIVPHSLPLVCSLVILPPSPQHFEFHFTKGSLCICATVRKLLQYVVQFWDVMKGTQEFFVDLKMYVPVYIRRGWC